jgi:uncharacterized cupin superfamily protein
MPILKLPLSTNCSTALLDDWGTVGLPLSEPACRLRGLKIDTPPGAPETGLWECTPGRYRRQINSAETMHLLEGEAVFTPDGGGPAITLKAGDVFFFPANSMGVWEIRSAVRKVYVLLDPAA